MAMDDTYRLVEGVLVDCRIALPSRHTDLVPYGPWKVANVLDATISANVATGSYNGYVRFVIEGEDHARQETFWNLWMAGWTSATFMHRCEEARQKERDQARSKRRSGKRRRRAK